MAHVTQDEFEIRRDEIRDVGAAGFRLGRQLAEGDCSSALEQREWVLAMQAPDRLAALSGWAEEYHAELWRSLDADGEAVFIAEAIRGFESI